MTTPRLKVPRKLWVLAFVVLLIALSLLWIQTSATSTHDPLNPRSRPNGYLMSASITVAKPVSQVFRFITYEKARHYRELDPAHTRFEITNADGLTEGAVILCEEYEEDEGVSHRYVVEDVIPNRLIAYASKPSKIYRKNSRGEMVESGSCNTYVYYDMEPSGEDETLLRQTIVIEMPNFLIKFVADIIGGEEGKETWESHLHEELLTLKNLVETEG